VSLEFPPGAGAALGKAIVAVMVAAAGFVGGGYTDLAERRAGVEFTELADATGLHISVLNDRIEDLTADKEMLIGDLRTLEAYGQQEINRVRAERELLRSRLEACLARSRPSGAELGDDDAAIQTAEHRGPHR